MRYNNPVFICGALRSGTTVLHLMLDNHEQINNPGEFDFLFDFIKADNHYPDPDQFISWLNSNRIFLSHNIPIIHPKPCFEDIIIDLVASYSRSGALTSLTIHRNFHLVPNFFPDSRYVHLLRDPRDVARSSIPMGWAGNVWYGVDHWIDTEKSWDKLQSILDPEQYIEIHYEELMQNPESILIDVCSFLEIPYSNTMLSYPDHSTYAGPDPTLTEQWKLKSNPKDVRLIENKASTLMKARGYDISFTNALPPSFPKRIYLALQNKTYRAIFGAKRYGLPLYIIDRLSRRFGPDKLRSYCHSRMDEIDISYLK